MSLLITLVKGFAGKTSHALLTNAVIVTNPAERT